MSIFQFSSVLDFVQVDDRRKHNWDYDLELKIVFELHLKLQVMVSDDSRSYIVTMHLFLKPEVSRELWPDVDGK